jgi:Fe-S oxidoreductase
VGVGECRREGGGTMCPSYMVTREEEHSTRGRARMLWEMMNGEVVDDGWKSEEVKRSLDLCLSCKGCKGDCPVNVDMATYKAEFLAHYYEGRLRPRHAFAFGWIHLWSRLASAAPTLANFVTQTPGLRSIAKWIAGMDPRRSIPPFAPQSFKAWFKSHEPKNPAGPPVLLFADTFNNYFHPDTPIAAVEVLEDAGFRVDVPMQDVCCGRPLYDYGFLNMARRWLLDLLAKLKPQIEAGVPMVVLEPSCWAVFKDELTNILPNNRDGQRLQANVFLIADFLKNKAPHYRLPKLRRKALLHGHCHQKALDHLNDKTYGELFNEKAVLRDMGVEFEAPTDGCCGMAGAFGFERGEHYGVSVKCGERALVPKVRDAADDELIIADGFSCREQIHQMTDRQGLHIAQVLQMALHEGPDGARDGRPESGMVRARRTAHRRAAIQTAALVAAGAVIGGWLYTSYRHRNNVARARRLA